MSSSDYDRRRVCEEPARQTVRNCEAEGAVVAERIKQTEDLHFGFNANMEIYEDLVLAGVIGPVKVTRMAQAECSFDCILDAHHLGHDRDVVENGD